MAQIINVLELPPKAFCNIRVKQESLYGTITFLPFPIALSAKADMTKPKTDKLLFMPAASFNLSPVAPVFPTF